MTPVATRVNQQVLCSTAQPGLVEAKILVMKAVKDLVREAREAFGMSQGDLADRSGIERPRISHVENGRNQASGFELRQSLAHGFGVPVEVFGDYLDGKAELDALLASSRAPNATQPTTVVDDPFEARAQAVAIMRGAGMPEPVLEALRHQSTMATRARTIEEWRAEGRALYKMMLEDRKAIEELEAPRVSAADKAKAFAKGAKR